VIVAAVDVVIPHLTNYKPRRLETTPIAAFELKLTNEIRDLYGAHRRHAWQPRADQIRRRCGCGRAVRAARPTQPPLALYFGSSTPSSPWDGWIVFRSSGLRRHPKRKPRHGGRLEKSMVGRAVR